MQSHYAPKMGIKQEYSLRNKLHGGVGSPSNDVSRLKLPAAYGGAHDLISDDTFLTGQNLEESVDFSEAAEIKEDSKWVIPIEPPEPVQRPVDVAKVNRRKQSKMLAKALKQLHNLPQELHRSKMDQKIAKFNNSLLEQGKREQLIKNRIEGHEQARDRKKQERMRMQARKQEQAKLRQFDRLERKRREVEQQEQARIQRIARMEMQEKEKEEKKKERQRVIVAKENSLRKHRKEQFERSAASMQQLEKSRVVSVHRMEQLASQKQERHKSRLLELEGQEELLVARRKEQFARSQAELQHLNKSQDLRAEARELREERKKLAKLSPEERQALQLKEMLRAVRGQSSPKPKRSPKKNYGSPSRPQNYGPLSHPQPSRSQPLPLRNAFQAAPMAPTGVSGGTVNIPAELQESLKDYFRDVEIDVKRRGAR